MAHPNQGHPQFRYSIQGPQQHFDSPSQASHRSNHASHQWGSMAPRIVQHGTLPSPSVSMRSMNSAPVRILHDRPSYRRPHIDDNIDPNLSGVGFLGPSGQVSQANFNIERNRGDDPWTPLHLSNPGDARFSLHQSNINYGQYNRGPGSVGSAAAPVSDSGYHSQSAVSTDPSQRQNDASRGTLRHLNVQAQVTNAPKMTRVLSDQRSQQSISSQGGQLHNELKCLRCSAVMKCRSDYK